VLAGDITVVNVLVASRALVSPLPVLGTLNVLDVHDVLHWLSGEGFRSGACNVIDHHLVAHELSCVGLNVVERLQLVDGV